MEEELSRNEKELYLLKTPHAYLWNELVYANMDFNSITYNMWGIPTIPVPSFHRSNIAKIAYECSDLNYQYPGKYNGIDELKESIIENFCPLLFNKKITLDEVYIAFGGVKAVHMIFETLFSKERGDEIITFEPYYPNHFSNHQIFHHLDNIHSIPFLYDKENLKFSLNFEALEKCLSSKTRILSVVNPCNPTTYNFTEEDIIRLNSYLTKYPNLILVQDAVYFPYLIGKENVFNNIANLNFDQTISIFSGGKLFNATGERCGWFIGNSDLLNQLIPTCYHENSFSPTFQQLVFAENLKSALREFNGNENFYKYIREISESSFMRFSAIISKYKMKIVKPMGTYYCVVDVSEYREKIPKEFYYDLLDNEKYHPYLDMAFCRLLLKWKLGACPMSEIQHTKDRIDYLIRFSINRVEETFKILERGLEEIQEEYNFL
jgi:aspartate/methionine/tyrosine aminotransferase